MDKKESLIGVEVQKRPDSSYDILRLSLPLPRLGMLLPPDTREHLRSAQRERLLAMRSMLDRWIAELEKPVNKPRQAGATRINVEEESTGTTEA